jgi:hypothetical protein
MDNDKIMLSFYIQVNRRMHMILIDMCLLRGVVYSIEGEMHGSFMVHDIHKRPFWLIYTVMIYASKRDVHL